MTNKRNYEWPQASTWDGYFTQDKSGGVTQRVDPATVMDRLRSEGFVDNVVFDETAPLEDQVLKFDQDSGSWKNAPQVKRNARPELSGTLTEIPPNTFEVFGTLTGNIEFTLGAIVDSSGVSEYHWIFTIGNTAYAVTWPSGIKWNGGTTPIIASNTTYEVSICEGLAIIGEFTP